MATSMRKRCKVIAITTATIVVVACAVGAFWWINRGSLASQIHGSPAFRERTTLALALLRSRAPEDYAEVCTVVKRITEADRSGTHVETGYIDIAAPSSLDVSLAWYASVLVHEARHVRLYLIEGTHRSGKAIFDAEVDCNNVQLAALRKVGGSPREIAWLISLMDGQHPDVDGDGNYSWEDYHRRRW
jgi:hypothetical protein